MIAILLLAWNYVRQQRAVSWVMAAYALGFAAIFMVLPKDNKIEDAEALYRQQACFAPMFALFLASAAVHQERKNRRILAVLSKAISRAQYLAGELAGIMLMVVGYLGCIGLATEVLSRYSQAAHLQTLHLWPGLGAAGVASLLAATAGLMFGVLLHPMFAAAAAITMLELPLLLAWLSPHMGGLIQLAEWLPLAKVVDHLLHYRWQSGWEWGWGFSARSVVVAAICFVVATAFFEQRDIAVAAE